MDNVTVHFDDPPLLDPDLEHKNWRTLKYVVFDLETTDFPFVNAEGERDGEALDRITGKRYDVNPGFTVVQFYGLMIEDFEVVKKLDLIIDPQMPIPPESTRIHGITDEMAQGQPTLDEVLEEIIEFLLEADFIAAFNGRFDQNCLQIECERRDRPIIYMNCLDLLAWERENRNSFSRNKLSDVAKRHGVAKMASVAHKVESLHDARVDVHVYSDLIREYAPKLPMTLGQMMKKQHAIQRRHDKHFVKKKLKREEKKRKKEKEST